MQGQELASNEPGSGGESALEHVIDNWPTAVAAIESSGAISFANAEARNLLMRLELVSINMSGQLALTSGHELEKCFLSKRSTLTLSPRNETPITLRLIRPKPNSTANTLLVVTEPDKQLPPSIDLYKDYDLSPAEIAVLAGLLNSETLAEIAIRRETTKNTVRSQLRSIFRKTRTHRQVELISLFFDGDK